MKICQFVASSGAGGLERHVIDLCNALSKRHDVTLIGSESFRARLDKRIEFVAFPDRGWRHSPIHLARLGGILRAASPDIVHAQANKAAAMVRTLRPLLRGTHTVATIHNRKRNVRAFSGFDWVIGVSSEVTAQIPSAQKSVIFNGIEPHAPLDSPDDRTPATEVLAVGRLVPAKGFDTLIRAWRGVPASLAIAGDGPERAMLEGLIKQYDLAGRVRLLGFRSDVAQLLQSAKLVVISSRREGFPYVLVEALHAKAVVLSTPVPGAVDVLPREAILEDASPEAIGSRVNEALAGLPQLQDRFESVWAFAQRELTVAAMAAKTEAVYEQLLQAPAKLRN